jgi:hypothetical protein
VEEKINSIFSDLLGYDPATSGHIGSKPITVEQVRQLFVAMAELEEPEKPVDNPVT